MNSDWGARNTVFIMGAGASKHIGVPVMTEFVDKMYDLYRGNGDAHSKVVFDLIRQWNRVFAHGSFDLNNIEALFSAADIERLIAVGEKEDETIEATYEALRTMIVRTVVDTQLYSYNTNSRRLYGENAYSKLLYELRKRPNRRYDFITVNYDLGLEFAFEEHGVQYDLGFGPWKQDVGHILKLHGSVNWVEEGSDIKVISPRDMAAESGGYKVTQMSNGMYKLKLGEYLDLSKALVIPPSFSKYGVDGPLRSVWSNAYRALRNARDIFIIGYSMPESDLMVRYLLSLAFRDIERVRTCWIINPDTRRSKYYEQLFGEYMRSKVRTVALKFEDIGSTDTEEGRLTPNNNYTNYLD